MKKLRRLLLKIKADRLLKAADRLAASMEEFPYVFKDRMLKLSLLSFFSWGCRDLCGDPDRGKKFYPVLMGALRDQSLSGCQTIPDCKAEKI